MFRNLITIALFFGAIGILFSLSWWQVQRLGWKNDFIAQLDAQYEKKTTNSVLSFNALQNLDNQDVPLLYGQITGKFIFDKQILWGPKPLEGRIGYNIITPLQLTSGEYVLVHRGWIDESKQQEALKKAPKAPLQVTITGLFRKPDWNMFTPNNSPDNNIWTKPDINEIARIQNIAPIAPVMLYAHEISSEFDDVILSEEKWYPRNKHKQYAIFWFAMGLAFIGVFGLYRYKKQQK